MEKGEFTKALTDLTVTSVEAGYRAGHIAGLREAAEISADHTPAKHDGTLAAHVTGRTIERTIRARITALEEEGKS